MYVKSKQRVVTKIKWGRAKPSARMRVGGKANKHCSSRAASRSRQWSPVRISQHSAK